MYVMFCEGQDETRGHCVTLLPDFRFCHLLLYWRVLSVVFYFIPFYILLCVPISPMLHLTFLVAVKS